MVCKLFYLFLLRERIREGRKEVCVRQGERNGNTHTHPNAQVRTNPDEKGHKKVKVM